MWDILCKWKWNQMNKHTERLISAAGHVCISASQEVQSHNNSLRQLSPLATSNTSEGASFILSSSYKRSFVIKWLYSGHWAVLEREEGCCSDILDEALVKSLKEKENKPKNVIWNKSCKGLDIPGRSERRGS